MAYNDVLALDIMLFISSQDTGNVFIEPTLIEMIHCFTILELIVLFGVNMKKNVISDIGTYDNMY